MIKVTHNSGFFSCCSVILDNIVQFINNHHNLPIVDSSEQFKWYKIKPGDITYDYFERKTRLEIKTLADNFLSTVQNDDGVYDFRNAKNVRNPLISKILEKYDEENRN